MLRHILNWVSIWSWWITYINILRKKWELKFSYLPGGGYGPCWGLYGAWPGTGAGAAATGTVGDGAAGAVADWPVGCSQLSEWVSR